jgi:hypothetical protein
MTLVSFIHPARDPMEPARGVIKLTFVDRVVIIGSIGNNTVHAGL